MPNAIITKVGTTKKLQALLSGTPVLLNTIKISSDILTITGDETTLPSVVYTVPSGNIQKQIIGTNTLALNVLLDESIGPFVIGTIGVFTSAGDLFALLNYPGVGTKTVDNLPSQSGNVKSLWFTMQDDNFNTAVNISIGSLLSGVVLANGSIPMTADLNVNSHKVLGVLNGTASSDGINLSQLQEFASFRTWSLKTNSYTSKTADRLLCNTASAGFNVTLPATPAVGNEIWIRDANGTFATHNLIVLRNGSTINGVADDIELDVNNIQAQITFYNGTWNIF